MTKKEKEDKIFYTKKTITQDPEDPSVQWIELDIYNFLKDQETEDKTIHWIGLIWLDLVWKHLKIIV